MRAHLPPAVLVLTLLLVAVTGCDRLRPPATPEPTMTQVAASGLSTDTPEPPPTETPDFIATLKAEATDLAVTRAAATAKPRPAPTLGAVLIPGSSGKPAPGCEIPRDPETWRIAPAPDAPADAQTAWGARDFATFTADVKEHVPAEKRYLLQPVDPAAGYQLDLGYSGEALPLETGKRYRFTWEADIPGTAPVGTALKVDDDAGLVFLGVSARETDGADLQLLKGDRAGFILHQLPTQCLFTLQTACGVELRAAPLEVTRGDAKATLNAGQSADLAGSPAYHVAVATSHYRRAVGDVACADPTDWVLSYRIARR
jgi:hypothetical protein